MELYRDVGYISQEQYETIESKCKGKGADLPDDCVKEMDKVLVPRSRSINYSMASISTTSSNLATKIITWMARK